MPKPPRPLVMAARVHGGQLKLSGKPVWREALSRWPDGPVDVEIRYREDTRRARANRFYWLALGKVVAYEREEGIGSGWSKDDWHEALKLAFNSKMIVDVVTGEETRVGRSTASLSISEFSDYLENCLLLFAERYGLVIQPTEADEWRQAA